MLLDWYIDVGGGDDDSVEAVLVIRLCKDRSRQIWL